MSQADFGNISSPQSGADFFDNKLEPWRDALHSGHSGVSRPSYAVAKMTWLNTTTSPIVWNYFDGTNDIPFALIDETANTFGLVAATIGANATQRHTLPAVASDTVALLDATQILLNKTLTNPTINATGGSITIPSAGAPTPTTTGQISYGTTANELVIGNGVGQTRIAAFITPTSYTPTLTNSTNVAASTLIEAQYMRLGDFVYVWGRITLDPTAASTSTILYMSLPIASNLGVLGGQATSYDYQGWSFGIFADTVNDRAQFQGIPSNLSNAGVSFSFCYKVI